MRRRVTLAAILAVLEARRDELATQLADMDQEDEDLEREVEELEQMVRRRTTGY